MYVRVIARIWYEFDAQNVKTTTFVFDALLLAPRLEHTSRGMII